MEVNSDPLLTIIIPCFNYEKYIGRAIDSVLSQGRPEVELLIVDDGSTDNSPILAEASGARVIRTSNQGQLKACLRGLEETTGGFVLFLDADDILNPQALDRLLPHLDPSLAKIQYSLTVIDGQDRPVKGGRVRLDPFRSREPLIEEIIRTGVYRTPPTSGNIFRRDLCQVLKEVDYDRAVDGVLLFAAPLFGDVLSLSEDMASYRVHGDNDSGLGAPPDPAIVARDLDRFLARTEHLRRLVVQRRPDLPSGAMRAATMPYYVQHQFYLDILLGQRPSLACLFRVLSGVVQERSGFKRTTVFAGFFLTAFLLPNRRAQAMLALRLNADDRSAAQILKVVLGGKPTPPSRNG